jgi:hypothetical protein
MAALENAEKILTEVVLAENALKNKSFLDIPPSSSTIETVKIWLNAFIPKYVPGYLNAPHPFEGKTMIHGPVPLSSTCYLTDNRAFDPNIRASSRMHSEIKIDVTMRIPVEVYQAHECTETVEIDCDTGEVTCNKPGKVIGKRFFDLTGTSDRFIFVNLEVGASNPCFPFSPLINHKGIIRVDVNSREVYYTGAIDAFPAFEMYASANDGEGVKLFQTMPEKGKTILDLPGDANVVQNGIAKI